MNKKDQSTISKILLALITIIALVLIIGFAYPYFMSPTQYVAPMTGQNPAIQDNRPHLPTVQSASPEVPFLTKITNLFKKGMPVYYGITTGDLINGKNFSDDASINSAILALGDHENAASRQDIGMHGFTAPGVGYYVYIAWPTAYENGGVFSCKAIISSGVPVGTVNCFSAGTSNQILFNTTDMLHRTVSNFVGPDGKTASYELYRAHFFISSGATVYYQPY